MNRTNIVVGVFALCLGANMARAVNYAESGDAGDLPGTAQSTGSATPLTSITGIISASGDGDMFRIFILDPANFVAATGDLQNANSGIAGNVVDPQLYLFDANGFGVLGNDDDGAGTRQSRLSGSGTLAAGIYYLLITGWDMDPTSSLGAIFPSGDPIINNSQVGPTGPGGGQPITGYTGDGGSNIGPYQITLLGAVGDTADTAIPEPATVALAGAALTTLGFLRRKKK